MLNKTNEEQEILEQIKDNTKDDMTYYFVSDPQFFSCLFWEILAFILNPLFGCAALTYTFIGHNYFMNKKLNEALDAYDKGKLTAKLGVYITIAILVLVLIIVVIKTAIEG